MSKARQVYELQEVDLDLDSKRLELAWVESQLGESEALVRARDGLAAEKLHAAQLEGEQREVEWQVDDLQAKITPFQQQLYSGKVKIPKELTNLQREVELLEAQRISLEDRVLEIMAQVEAAQDRIKEKTRELAQIEEEWRQAQERLSKEQQELKTALAAIEQRRGILLTKMDPPDVQSYQVLRDRKQGQAVARVAQGMCQGCRIALPLAELQRVREDGGLVYCSSCGRILYMG
jgi:predicted  nucleic acid-binding Zn-ribbon protein